MPKPAKPKILIVTAYGVNCEAESAHAWQLAGGVPVLMHMQDLLQSPPVLQRFQALMFIGGFSFGDHMGSGHAMALRWRHRLQEHLLKFLDRGNLALGICNGFQVMVKLGLLPGPADRHLQPRVALIHNANGVFQNYWITLCFDPESPCVFTRGLTCMQLPIRHGEGRLYVPGRAGLDALEKRGCIPCRYAHPRTGRPSMRFPHNPNGSRNAIAGLCTPDGRVFGMMPHPEAFLFPENHPHWTRRPPGAMRPQHGAGLSIFLNAVEHITG